jgi:hypothetical protein
MGHAGPVRMRTAFFKTPALMASRTLGGTAMSSPAPHRMHRASGAIAVLLALPRPFLCLAAGATLLLAASWQSLWPRSLEAPPPFASVPPLLPWRSRLLP